MLPRLDLQGPRAGSVHKLAIHRGSAWRHSPPARQSATPDGRLSLIVAATPRRPVSRDLLDNVDSASPYGFTGDAWSTGRLAGNGLEEPYAGTPTIGSDPTSEPSTSETSSQGATTWDAFDPTARLPEDQRRQPQSQPSPGPNSSGPSPSGYGLNGYEPNSYSYEYGNKGYDNNGYGSGDAADRWESRDTGTASRAPPTGPSAGTAAGAPPWGAPPHSGGASQAQQPSAPQPQQRRWPGSGSGADWGEPDPLTDWGGGAASSSANSAGWDYDYGAAGAGPSGPPGSATTAQTAAANASGASGVAPPGDGEEDWPRRGSGSAAAAAAGGSAFPDTEPGPGPAATRDAPGTAGTGAFGSGNGNGYGYGYDSVDGWGQARGRTAQGVGYDGGGGGGASSSGQGAAPPPPGALRPSDIVLLSGRDASSIMPLAPTSGQVEYFQPRSLQERIVQYLGSLGASVLLSKAAVLAGPALLYPIWSPWIRAGLRNLDLYSATFAAVGLWRAQVLDVQITGLPLGGVALSRRPPTVSLLIGDPWAGGARSALDLPYLPRAELIQPGDLVELLVLCRDERFVSFKVVKELYFPQSGAWLCDYPLVNRDLFLAASLAIERERRAAADAAAAASYYTYDVPYETAAGPAGTATDAGTEQGAAAEGFGPGRGAAGPPGGGAGPAGAPWAPRGGWQ